MPGHRNPATRPSTRTASKSFDTGIRELAPYILAPPGAERQEERLSLRTPSPARVHRGRRACHELSVRCRLDDRELGGTVLSRCVCSCPPRGTPTAFVVWGTRPWPPTTPEEAEALATALSDLLDTGHFEAFLALINAPTDESRLKLLRLAGAPTDLTAPREALTTTSLVRSLTRRAKRTSRARHQAKQRARRQPRLRQEQTVAWSRQRRRYFDPRICSSTGSPSASPATARSPRASARGRRSDARTGTAGARRYGGHTDLGELDRLGMYVALTFERNRLKRKASKSRDLRLTTNRNSQPALVFDVSTLAAIEQARATHSCSARPSLISNATGSLVTLPALTSLRSTRSDPRTSIGSSS